MTRGQEKFGRALARAIRSMEFDARLTEGDPLEADVVEGGVGGPRVEIRHPRLESRGVLWLVAIIALEPAPAISYAVPAYRQTIELVLRLVLRRALPARAA